MKEVGARSVGSGMTTKRRGESPQMLYIQDDNGNILERDERSVLGVDNGVADFLESLSGKWASRPLRRCVYHIVISPHGFDFGLLNMGDRKEFARSWRSGRVKDVVGAKWLTDKARDHARLLVAITASQSTLLVNASRDFPRLRRHHIFGYQLEPGSTNHALGLAPDGTPLS